MVAPDFRSLLVEQNKLWCKRKADFFAQLAAEVGMDVDSQDIEVVFNIADDIFNDRAKSHASAAVIAKKFHKGWPSVV